MKCTYARGQVLHAMQCNPKMIEYNHFGKKKSKKY